MTSVPRPRSRGDATSRASRRVDSHERLATPDATRLYATCVPGLAPIVRRQMAALPGIVVTDIGFDGRSDLILFEATPEGRPAAQSLGTTEDVFVEVGRTRRAEGDEPGWIAGRIWRRSRVEHALAVWAQEVRALSSSATFRVIARVLQERSFLRTDLRRALTRTIQATKPRWRVADPAEVEVWITEYRRGQIVTGLRLTDTRTRKHGGRRVERPGALRPSVAAAMVHLAGEPSGLLLDPCCGAGTILLEALTGGWQVTGVDIDPLAVDAARRNVPLATVHLGDARHLDLPDGSVGASVSNLPFGRQYSVQGTPAQWTARVLAEIARVTRRGGRAVLLSPEIPNNSMPAALRLEEKLPIRVLGTRATIWTFGRERDGVHHQGRTAAGKSTPDITSSKSAAP